MKDILRDYNFYSLLKKTYFCYNIYQINYYSKIHVNIKLKKIRVHLIKKFFLLLELILGQKPIIRKIYFKRISKKKIQLRLIFFKNIRFKYIWNFIDFFVFLIKLLPLCSRFYRIRLNPWKRFFRSNLNTSRFNIYNIFNLISFNSTDATKFIFKRTIKTNFMIYFINIDKQINKDFFLEIKNMLHDFERSWY